MWWERVVLDATLGMFCGCELVGSGAAGDEDGPPTTTTAAAAASGCASVRLSLLLSVFPS